MNAPAPGAVLVTPTGVQDSPPELQYTDRRAWLYRRRRGVGSSDIAAICGLTTRRSALHIYLDKRGIAPAEKPDRRRDEAAEIGLLMEPVIAELVRRRTGLSVLPHPGTVAHVDEPWMLASVDALLAEGDTAPSGILEKKTRSEHQADEWTEDAPWEVQVQVQWQMAVTGYTWAMIAAVIGGNQLVIHRLQAEPVLHQDLRTIAARFWTDTQQGIEPPADGGDASRALLTARWPKAAKGSVLHAAHDLVAPLLERRAHAKTVLDDWGQELSVVENRLRQIAGDHETVLVGGRPVYTLRSSTHSSADTAALRTAGLYETYRKTTPVRTLQIVGEATQ